MIKYLSQLDKKDLFGRKVLLRVDFNVPLKVASLPSPLASAGPAGPADTLRLEDFRIRAHRETVEFLLSGGAKILLVSHLDEAESFSSLTEAIGQSLGQTLTLLPLAALDQLDRLWSVSPILLLDNIRQDPREEKNDPELAKLLAQGFDFYINDAFSVSHRAHALLVAITSFLPSWGGFLMEKEIKNLTQALEAPAQGKVVVLGGAKISIKLPVIKNFLPKAEKILIGGALANNFFKAQGFKVGASMVDDSVVLSFLKEPEIRGEEGSKIVLPRDIIISTRSSLKTETAPLKDVGFTQLIADIGPETIKRFEQIIKQAEMVIWNGPMGLSEDPAFARGTAIVAEAVSKAKRSIVGGGDTIAALHRWGLLEKYSFVSTGGGAMLDFLAGESLPGLVALGYDGKS